MAIQTGMTRVCAFFALSVVTLSCGRSKLEDASVLSERPVAVITPASITSPVGAAITLNGESSYDPLGANVIYAWLITQRPTGSAATFDSATVRKPRLTPDLIGFWEVQLVVSAGMRVSEPVAASITIVAAMPPLDAGSTGVFDAGARADGGSSMGVDAGTAAVDAGSLQVLDPGEVYLMGTLSEGACYRDALAHWSTPNVASVGFDCYADESGAVIRPGDGRLLYTNTFEDKLREYHCDDCSYSSVSTAYPANVLANDTVLPTPCPSTNDRMTWFRVSAEGEVLHQCGMSIGQLRNATGAVVYDGTGDPVRAVGGSGWLLTEKKVVNYKTGVSVVLKGAIPVSNPVAIRWSAPDAFFIAYKPELHQASLYRAAFSTGGEDRVGGYPDLLAGLTSRYNYRLDSAGRLFFFASLSNSFTDVIVRSEVGGESKIAYSEADRPLVKIHISSLVTGP